MLFWILFPFIIIALISMFTNPTTIVTARGTGGKPMTCRKHVEDWSDDMQIKKRKKKKNSWSHGACMCLTPFECELGVYSGEQDRMELHQLLIIIGLKMNSFTTHIRKCKCVVVLDCGESYLWGWITRENETKIFRNRWERLMKLISKMIWSCRKECRSYNSISNWFIWFEISCVCDE